MAVGATEYSYPGVIPGPRGHNVTLVELYVTDHTGVLRGNINSFSKIHVLQVQSSKRLKVKRNIRKRNVSKIG